MKPGVVSWVERFFYAPTAGQKLLARGLWPLSLLYCAGAAWRYRRARPRDFGIPVVSVGNLTVGGSGKTPLTVALAAAVERPAVVLRGYGRKSDGLQVVSEGRSAVLCNVECSGDEAMLYALQLPEAAVIVAENRDEAIERAKELGCRAVFLDDGYGKHHIEKYDIVIEVETPNRFCLPAGPYRERLWAGKKVRVVKEGRDFRRRVEIVDGAEKMVLVTAIARPERLEPFLPPVLSKHCFPDHHYFTKEELEAILRNSGADRLLVTYKDYVKIRHFDLPLALMDLKLEVNPDVIAGVKKYIQERLK